MIPNANITIYNKFINAQKEYFQRSVVSDVVWQSTKSVSGLGSGKLANNTATILIPIGSASNYLPPKAWLALENKAGKWTLLEGDFIVRGEVADEITTTFTISALKKKYDYVVEITSVDDMLEGSEAVQHYEVGAK